MNNKPSDNSEIISSSELHKSLNSKNIILASQSPRRKELFSGLNIPFKVEVREVDEIYPEGMPAEEVPLYLAKLKASAFNNDLNTNSLIITADTVVIVEGEVLGKPNDYQHGVEMLRKLSGKKHEVITGVCILAIDKMKLFSAKSDVFFKVLSDAEIDYYLNNYHPYDKAGSYGVQEWIGYIAIERIEGSYYNVMGLPIQMLYQELLKF